MNLTLTHTLTRKPPSLDGRPIPTTEIHTSVTTAATIIINEDAYGDQVGNAITTAKRQNEATIHRLLYGEIRKDLSRILDMTYRAGSVQLSEAIPQALNALLAKIPY